MKKFLSILIKRPVTICTIIILLMIGGILSTSNMAVNLLPKMDFPMLGVTVIYPGASAKTVDSDITVPLENNLRTIASIKSMTTYSLDNASVVIVTFEYETNIDKKTAEIEKKLQSLSLPTGANNPQITTVDLNSGAVASIALYRDDSDNQKLYEDAIKLEKALYNIEGIGQIELLGNPDKEIIVTGLAGLDISTLLVVEALKTEGMDIPFGTITENNKTISLRNGSNVTSIEEIKNLPITLTLPTSTINEFIKIKDLLNKYEEMSLPSLKDYIVKLRAIRGAYKLFGESILSNYPEIANNQMAMVMITNKDFEHMEKVLLNHKEQHVNELGNVINDENQEVSFISEDPNFVRPIIITSEEYYMMYKELGINTELAINPTVDLINFLRKLDLNNSVTKDDETSIYLKLEDISHIDTVTTYDTYAKYNDKQSIVVNVYAISGANTTSIVEEVKTKLATVNITSSNQLLDDKASFINDSIGNILTSIIIGGALAIIIIFLFVRRVKSAIIIAITMPLSVLVALLLLWVQGISLNMVSLGGLAVGIGMLVDNSIVVIESITKHRDMGEDVHDASINGVKEVASALLASTLTNLCVFIPILFTKGMTKIIFNDLVYAIIYSTLMSLVVAILVIPTLYYLAYKKETNYHEDHESWIKKLELGYQKVLRALLVKKGLVLIIALCLFIISTALVFTSKTEFLPSIDQGKIEVNLEYDAGVGIEKANEDTEKVAYAIKDLEGINYVSMTTGVQGLIATNVSGIIQVEVNTDIVKTSEIAKEIRKLVSLSDIAISKSVKEIDGVVAEVTSGFASLSAVIKGQDVETLKTICHEVETRIEKEKGFASSTDDISLNTIEYIYHIDKNKCQMYGIDYTNVVMLLRVGIAGYTSANVKIDGENYNVIAKFDNTTLTSVDKIGQVIVGYNKENPIMINDICTISHNVTNANIKRLDGEYVSTINFEIEDLTSGEATKTIEKVVMEVLADYEGYTYSKSGVSSYLADALKGLVISLVAAFILLYAIMSCQFESLSKPIIIIMAIPFAFTGGFLSLWVSGISLNVVSFIGLIMLMGVIINNAIVLVDHINYLISEKNLDIKDAVIEGSSNRLRAVMMTSLTTILALVPLSLGLGSGGKLMQPMGIVVLGGLTLATLVTLVIIPCFYALMKRIKYGEKTK